LLKRPDWDGSSIWSPDMTEDAINTTSAALALKPILNKQTFSTARQHLPIEASKSGNDIFERAQYRLYTLHELIVLEHLEILRGEFPRCDGANDLQT
jgi:hypothetical protein